MKLSDGRSCLKTGSNGFKLMVGKRGMVVSRPSKETTANVGRQATWKRVDTCLWNARGRSFAGLIFSDTVIVLVVVLVLVKNRAAVV